MFGAHLAPYLGGMTPLRRILLAASALAVTVTLAGCSAASVDSGLTPGNSSGSGVSDVAVDPGLSGGAASDAISKEAIAPNATGLAGSSTVTSTWMSLSVSNPVTSADDAATIATDAQGYVESRSESTGGGVVVPLSGVKGDGTVSGSAEDGSAGAGQPVEYVSLTLRVPAAKAGDVVTSLKELGRLSSYNESQYDVGLQQADLTSRIATLTESLTALRALQSQSTNVSDLLAAEAAISTRQAELDSLVAQQDYLSNQVEMTSISVDFSSQTAGLSNNLTFLDGLAFGWGSIGAAIAGLGVGLGFVLPWLGVLVVLAGIVAAIVIPLARRERARLATAGRGGKPNAAATPARTARKPQSK